MKQEMGGLAAELRLNDGVRYEESLRGRVGKFVRRARRQVATWSALSDGSGVPCGTLRRWAGSGVACSGFAEVRVADSSRTAAPVAIRVVSATGWCIEGLTAEQAVRLVRGVRS